MDNLNKLLIKVSHRDGSAFEKLYNSTRTAVFAVVLSVVRNKHIAEDIMQDAYVKIYENAGKYKKGTNAKAWILTVAKNLAINEYNRNKKCFDVDFSENESLFGEYTFENNFADSLALKKALAILKEDQREIMLLFASGLKQREIADYLGVPLGTVSWKYSEALKKVKEALV